MKSLLHAAAAVLTVLLLLLQPRCPLAAVCYKKINISGHWFQSDDVNIDSMNCGGHAYSAPKYKKDPQIHVDSELIGQEPQD